MGWWKKFREFDDKGFLIHRVEGDFGITKRGFIFDRRIFQGYMIVVFLVIFYIMATSEVPIRAFYSECVDDGEACMNPCYNNGEAVCASYRDMEFLRPGESIGVPPDPAYGRQLHGLLFVIGFGFLVAFSLNKLLWNRGRSLETIFLEVELDDGRKSEDEE